MSGESGGHRNGQRSSPAVRIGVHAITIQAMTECGLHLGWRGWMGATCGLSSALQAISSPLVLAGGWWQGGYFLIPAATTEGGLRSSVWSSLPSGSDQK